MIPTLKEIVAKLDVVHSQRLQADKQARELASQEAALKQALINYMTEQEVASIGSDKYMFSVKEKTRYQVVDWPSVYAYIAQHDAWEIMYRRCNDAALAERGDVPGVEPYEMHELSIRARN
jgi:hypothetical protein